MKRLCTYVLLSKKTIILSICLCVCLCMTAQNPYKKYTENLPFEMPEVKAPVIPDTKVCLKDFGADPTGISLCTDAFVKAVDGLTAKGGGHLIVPAGVWLTGPIVLKSNIDLHLEMGAVIRFAADERLYPIIKTSFEGLDTRRCQSPLSAVDAVNISITGAVSASARCSVIWLPSDFKKRNGFLRSCEITAEYGMYRQDYCGCVFSMREGTGHVSGEEAEMPVSPPEARP